MAGPWSVTGRNRRSFHWITSLVIPSAFRRSRALGLNPRTGTAREQPRAAVTSLCFAAGGWKEVVGQLPLTPAWPEVGGKDAGRLIRIAWIGHTCARLIVLRAGRRPTRPARLGRSRRAPRLQWRTLPGGRGDFRPGRRC